MITVLQHVYKDNRALLYDLLCNLVSCLNVNIQTF